MGKKKDNFWEMGDTGPCGPCTEIHIDSRSDEERKKIDGKTLVNNDHPQVIEIWNIVFIQYNRKTDGSLEPLPAKHVDTGMGFERLVRVLQNKQSNYDTDIFSGTIAEVEKIVGLKYTPESVVHPNIGPIERQVDIAFRVIADHIRAICFTIADGQLPSNTGAGYVIRRILRRAVRYYFSNLDHKEPLLHKLVPIVANQFKDVFPELKKQKDFVSKIVHEEEQNFLKTLEKGIIKLSEYIKSHGQTGQGLEEMPFANFSDEFEFGVPGKVVFDLYDTFGFPSDLTKLISKDYNWGIDEIGFEREMQQQKSRSRAASAIDSEDWIKLNDTVGVYGVTMTDDYGREIPTKIKNTNIIKYRKVKQKNSEFYQIVLGATNFYPEGGGQVGDTGILIADNKNIIEIFDTKKENDTIIHFAKKIPENLNKQTIIETRYNADKRKKTAIHHSATHLMHAALRKVLGNHVAQKGSLVNDEYLRFDFSHFAKVTDEEIKKVESIVNEKIRANIPVVIKEMKKEDALATGAMALFGEKYGNTVRVVTIDPSYSIELCGGTHVDNTGELGFFKITTETAVGAGIRRIEALSGKAAEDYVQKEFDIIHNVRESLKNPKDLSKGIDNLISENSDLKKQLEKLEGKQLLSIKNELLQKVEKIDDINFIGQQVDVPNADALKKICFSLKGDLNNYVVVLVANIDGKSNVAVMLMIM